MVSGSCVTMAWLQSVYGEALQKWRVVVNIINKQLQTYNKVRGFQLEVSMIC